MKRSQYNVYGPKALYSAIDTAKNTLETLIFFERIENDLESYLKSRKEALLPEEMIRLFRRIVSGISYIEHHLRNNEYHKTFDLKDIFLIKNERKGKIDYKLNMLDVNERQELHNFFNFWMENVDKSLEQLDEEGYQLDLEYFFSRNKHFPTSISVIGLLMYLVVFPNEIENKAINIDKIKVKLQEERQEPTKPLFILDILEAILITKTLQKNHDILIELNKIKSLLYKELKLEKFLQSREVFRILDLNKKNIFYIPNNLPFLVSFNYYSHEIRNYKLVYGDEEISYNGALITHFCVNENNNHMYAFGAHPKDYEVWIFFKIKLEEPKLKGIVFYIKVEVKFLSKQKKYFIFNKITTKPLLLCFFRMNVKHFLK